MRAMKNALFFFLVAAVLILLVRHVLLHEGGCESTKDKLGGPPTQQGLSYRPVIFLFYHYCRVRAPPREQV